MTRNDLISSTPVQIKISIAQPDTSIQTMQDNGLNPLLINASDCQGYFLSCNISQSLHKSQLFI